VATAAAIGRISSLPRRIGSFSSGVDDPLVLYFAARTIQRVEDNADETKKRYERALQGAETLSLSPALRRLIALELANLRHGAIDQKSWDARAGEWAVAALEDGSYGHEDTAVFLRHVLTCPASEHLDRAPEAVHASATSKKLPEWARHTLMGYIEVARAWQARTGKWASEVTPEGWSEFEKRLKLARQELVKAWKLNPREPYAAARMISVVMGGAGARGESERLWFDRAVEAQFDYGAAYSFLLNAWRPRWGGDHQRMYAFGRACRATGRYDTEVPRVFTQACNEIGDDLDWETIYRSGEFPDIKDEMLDHHEKLLAEPTREEWRWMDRSFLAINAYLVGAFDTADSALRALPKGLYPPAIDKVRKLDRSVAGFRWEVALLNSPAQESYSRGEKLFREQELSAAKPHFEAALPKAPEETKAFIQARLDAIERKAEFDKGGWVTLPVQPGLPGWRVITGEWEVGADGELILHGRGSKAEIIYEVSPAPDYEWRAECRMEVPEGADPAAGLAFGFRGFDDRQNLSAGVWCSSERGIFQATLFRAFGSEKAPVRTVPIRPMNELSVRVRQNRVTFHVNGWRYLATLSRGEAKPAHPGA
jgi:hypothetical protein